MEVKFNNPFAQKKAALQRAATDICKGCGDPLPIMHEDTVRTWCSRPKRTECRKLYYRNRHND